MVGEHQQHLQSTAKAVACCQYMICGIGVRAPAWLPPLKFLLLESNARTSFHTKAPAPVVVERLILVGLCAQGNAA